MTRALLAFAAVVPLFAFTGNAAFPSGRDDGWANQWNIGPIERKAPPGALKAGSARPKLDVSKSAEAGEKDAATNKGGYDNQVLTGTATPTRGAGGEARKSRTPSNATP